MSVRKELVCEQGKGGEGWGVGERSRYRKKGGGGGEEGVKPIDKDLKACRNRRRNLTLY